VTIRARLLGTAAVAASLACACAASTARSAESRAVPRIAHVVVVVFENHERESVLGSNDAPTFDALARTYAQASDYRAVAHPSLPNYLAMVSGSTHGVTTDCSGCTQSGPTIGTQLTAAKKRWAAYAEGYPGSPRFAKKHVPFLYFPQDARHVLPLSAFRPNALPAFSFVVPDRCHDMHDCSIATGDAWLAAFVRPLLKQPKTVVFVVFDEGTSTIGGGGVVPLIVAGKQVRPHSVVSAQTDHYTLLRTIEDALGLRPLGQAKTAKPLTGIWR
jgi:acid phosphatase